MLKYSSMTIDELEYEFNRIDKIKYPKEAVAIHGELSKKRDKLSKELQEIESTDILKKNSEATPETNKLKALSAIIIFISFLIAKYLSVLIYTFIFFMHKFVADELRNFQKDQIGPLVNTFTTDNINKLVTVEFVFGGLALFLMTKLLASNLINKEGDHAIGWVWKNNNFIWKAFLTGIGLGLILLLVSGGNTYPKYIGDFSITKWIELMCMVISILLLAPIIEEYLFRGVLYAGFANTWNKDISSVLITFIFVLIHLPVVEYNIIPLFSIIALAITTLFFKEKAVASGRR